MFQIQHLKQQEKKNSDAVQQGEVSSSNPTIISNDVLGPLLLEVRVLVGWNTCRM
jgi:nuclear receptor coactivator 2